jgi:rubrerythrin
MSVIDAEEARHAIHPASRSRQRAALRSKPATRIDSVGAPQGHALAIAHEAIARYGEFAKHMADHGDDELADLFGRLAELEAEHTRRLPQAAAGMASRLAPGEYAWLHSGPPLQEAHDFIFCMLTPRLALEIAVRAEQRAKVFFGRVLAESDNAADRELAMEFGRDEESHIAWLQDALVRVPKPFQPSEECPGDPTAPYAM